MLFRQFLFEMGYIVVPSREVMAVLDGDHEEHIKET